MTSVAGEKSASFAYHLHIICISFAYQFHGFATFDRRAIVDCVLFPSCTGFQWVFTGFYWVSMGFTGFQWVLLGFTGFQWVSMGFTGFDWV